MLPLLVLWDFLSSLNPLTYLEQRREVELGCPQWGSIRSERCGSLMGVPRGQIRGGQREVVSVSSAGLTELRWGWERRREQAPLVPQACLKQAEFSGCLIAAQASFSRLGRM